MSEGRKTERRFPCHAWEIKDAEEAAKDLHVTQVKEYGSKTQLEDGTKLHDNYDPNDSYGTRRLYRCRKCGALMIEQVSMDDWDWEEPDIDRYYNPVSSVEVADLLNILEDNLMPYPYRSLHSYTSLRTQYFWTGGEEPVPYDPGELKERIRKKYAWLKPKQKELLEKMIREAGKTAEGMKDDRSE